MQPRDGREGVEVTGHSKKAEYTQLGLKVLIVGNCFLSGAISMFARAGCEKADNVADADLVCFLGGADVDPSLYGEKAIPLTSCDPARDAREIDIFTDCVALGKPMFGICRGMQFLAAMNGNKLYQHVLHHAGRPHNIKDLQTGEILLASSLHHQMVIENATTFPIAYSVSTSGTYITAEKTLRTDKHNDLEAAAFPNIRAICVQGHPELGDIPTYTEWCLRKVKEFLDNDCSIVDRPVEEPLVLIPPQPAGLALQDIAFLNQGVKDA